MKTLELLYPIIKFSIEVSNPLGAKLLRVLSFKVGRESDPYNKWIKELAVRENIKISVFINRVDLCGVKRLIL